MASYGLDDLSGFFCAVIDGEFNGGDEKDVDLGNMVSGEVPPCFFSLPFVNDPYLQLFGLTPT